MSIPSPILLLTNQLTTGGAEVYVLTVSAWLAEQGVQVEIAASPGDLVDRIDPRVRYHPVPLKDLRLGIPAAAARIGAIVRRLRPQVILANSMVTAWVARLANPRLDIPVVAVAHGWPARRYMWVARPLSVADRVVPVSHDVAMRLQRAGLSPERCTIVPNGVDLSPYIPRTRAQRDAARAAFGAGPDDVVVANVGRFVSQKRQERILEIAARLRDVAPHVRYGIIGWGEREAELREEIAARGLGDIVRLLVKRTDVPDLLLASDLYLSTSDWEGMPLSMIEAMAASLPIVATDVEGMRALIDSSNGVLVPPGDLDGLVEGVRRLATDPAARLSRGGESRLRAEQQFSRDVMCRRLAAVLSEVVAARGGPA
jgi:glycosyltransferase involved in cell wall biosynthesis